MYIYRYNSSYSLTTKLTNIHSKFTSLRIFDEVFKLIIS